MDWPTWRQSGIATLISVALVVLLRRVRPGRWRDLTSVTAQEFGLLAGLYSLWRLARMLPLATTTGAIERARWIARAQHAVYLPSELSLQRLAIDQAWFGRFLNAYYAVVHVPALLLFLVWLFARHRDHYPRWRNGLAAVTGFCLFIRFIRVAPPRLVPDLGYLDLSSLFGWSVYGPVGTGVSDQFAAMPSIHVAWAAVVSFGVVAASPSRWRWVFVAHIVLTMLCVSATGNHWWLDGIVALALLGIGLKLDTWVFAPLARRRAARAARAAGQLVV